MNDNTNPSIVNTEPTDATPADTTGGQGEKLFTQKDLDRIVGDRLARQYRQLTQQSPEDAREMALKARENRLDCREHLAAQGLPAELAEILDTSDVKTFKSNLERLTALLAPKEDPKRPAFDWTAPLSGTQANGRARSTIADAFKPPKI